TLILLRAVLLHQWVAVGRMRLEPEQLGQVFGAFCSFRRLPRCWTPIKASLKKHFAPWTPTEREKALLKVATGLEMGAQGIRGLLKFEYAHPCTLTKSDPRKHHRGVDLAVMRCRMRCYRWRPRPMRCIKGGV